MKLTPRLLALSTVGVAATLAVVSGTFAAFSEKLLPSATHDCTALTHDAYGYGYGYDGYGYGYDCTERKSSGNGAGGSSSSATSTIITPANNVDITRPNTVPNNVTVTIFSGFKKQCSGEVKNLTDTRITAYYDVLNVVNRTNLGRSLTRAEFLKLVLNSANVNVSGEADPTYSDVPANHTLKQYIAYATRIGMVSGQNNLFRPNDMISRSEAVKIIVNAAGLPLSTNIVTFADVNTSNSLATYIQTAYDNCIVHGRKTLDGNPINPPRVFEPTSAITLAETAKILYNINN